MWAQIRLLLYDQSDPDPHCLPVCKTSFEKFARIFSRQHKKPTFSDAGFLGILRVKLNAGFLGILRVKLLLTRQSLYTGRSHKVLPVL